MVLSLTLGSLPDRQAKSNDLQEQLLTLRLPAQRDALTFYG
jgi:hypothetical protein